MKLGLPPRRFKANISDSASDHLPISVDKGLNILNVTKFIQHSLHISLQAIEMCRTLDLDMRVDHTAEDAGSDCDGRHRGLTDCQMR
jgi:hypothetical protein